MGFNVFDRSEIEELLLRTAEADRITVLVGAGASVDAGLPAWQALLERLLLRAGEHQGLIDPSEGQAAEQWIRGTIETEGYLGAAAIVEVLSEDQLPRWLPEALYGDRGPSNFLPGPIAQQVAYLRAVGGDRIRIDTTNYDALVEQALRERDDIDLPVVPYVGPETELPNGDHIAIGHIHGYAGSDGVRGELVLSEEQYHRLQRGGAWQEAWIGGHLQESLCVFVGSGLGDPNLLRYLYTYTGARRHAAIFVRQAEREDLPANVRAARETAAIGRFDRVNVDAVFVDHFADVAQLLHEIGLRRVQGGAYTPLPERARTWLGQVLREVVGSHDQDAFVSGQRALNSTLREALQEAITAGEEFTGEPWDEILQLALWLVDEGGSMITNWAMTDRLHFELRTIEPVEVHPQKRWVAIKAFCRGAPLGEERDIYASRWRYVLGLPLTVETEGHGLLPVGCLTVASMENRDQTVLHEMPGDVQAEFNKTLREGVMDLLGKAFL
jgi:hypothetical protein